MMKSQESLTALALRGVSNLSNPSHQDILLKAGISQDKINTLYEKQKRGEKLASWIKINNKIIRIPESPEDIQKRREVRKQIIHHRKERKEQKLDEEFQIDEFSEMSEHKKMKKEFFKTVEQSILVKTSCWIWIGNQEELLAMQIKAYEIFKEKLNSNSILKHKCENSKCINPNHLYQHLLIH